jgi:hypothetical protein
MKTKRNIGLGGLVTGPLHSDVPGRTDALPIDVPEGSYVIPADVVSALGQGNTAAGQKALAAMTKPKGPVRHKAIPRPTKANGGAVPIAAAGGEHVITPADVSAIGGGDMERGHEILDEFVKAVRAENIQHLASLPGPRK